MKFAWIQEHRDSYPIAVMCRVLCVSTSGFYAWGKRAPGPRAQRAERIRDSISRVFEQSSRIYGSHEIAQKLTNDEQLETACRNTVAKAMHEMVLKSSVIGKFTPTTTTTDPDKIPAPNVLDQVFTASSPNQK